MTKVRVLQLARTMGYRPNLAARYLSSKKTWRISVNTLKGNTSFWDEVRAGIREEAASILLENVEIEFRTHRRLGEGEEEAFESAIRDQVNGIITFPSRPQILRPWIRRASRAQIPVVCVATDAPHSGRLGIVAVDTLASGSIAAALMRNIADRCAFAAATSPLSTPPADSKMFDTTAPGSTAWTWM